MTGVDDGFAVTLARLEGKLDTLSVKVDAGDRAAAQLVELVKSELGNVKEAVDKLEALVAQGAQKNDRALTSVRIDLEDQIKGHVEGAKVAHADMHARLTSLEAARNRMYGGLSLASALGVAELIAILRHLS